MNEEDILQLVRNDEWMMRVLKVARDLDLPDWMIGAGFIRNKVWGHLHGFVRESNSGSDIDLIYFDQQNLEESHENILEADLKSKLAGDWSVTNQARMNVPNEDAPYISASDALAHWVETATCVAIRLVREEVVIIAPYGIQDLVDLFLRPTPPMFHRLNNFHERVARKKWLEKWPKLRVVV